MKGGRLRLVMANLRDDPVRFGVVFAASALLAACLAFVLLVTLGARRAVAGARERMGADVLVVGKGNQQVVEDALLFGHPTSVWLDRSALDDIRAMPGVAAASPQLFLSTMRGASCCTVSDMFMVAYEPETDFTVAPWLTGGQGRLPGRGEAVGGRYVQVPPGEDAILIYGYEIDLTGNLEASGSGLDQAMFFTYETALDIAAQSPMQAEKELVLRPYSVSAILVKAAPGTTAEELAARIRQARPDAQATPRERIFASQADAARRTEGVLLLLLLAAFLIALGCAAAAAAISAASRRQHVGVLRSLGATARGTRALVAWESLVPAASGALAGAVLGLSCVLLFRTLIQERMGVPVYVFPPPALAALALLCALATALCAWLAGAVPAGRILLGDPDSLLKEA